MSVYFSSNNFNNKILLLKQERPPNVAKLNQELVEKDAEDLKIGKKLTDIFDSEKEIYILI